MVRQVTCRSCQQGTVAETKRRPPDLATQDLELVPKHHQLDVLHVQATATAHKHAEQSPDEEIEEREGLATILPVLAQRSRDTNNGALHVVF